MKNIILFFFGALMITKSFGQDDYSQVITDLAWQTQGYLEGFQKNTGGNEFIYQGFRSEVTQCLLTRCTDGRMPIQWNSQAVPSAIQSSGAGFTWIAGMDLTREKVNFDLFIDGIKRFTIPSSEQGNWTIKNDAGGALNFVMIEKDLNGDAQGYMTLWAPKAWLHTGKPLILELKGQAMNSNCWMVVYQADDAQAYLQKSALFKSWAEATISHSTSDLIVDLKMPLQYAGKPLYFKSGNSQESVIIKKNGNYSSGQFSISPSAFGQEFFIKDLHDILIYADRLGNPGKTSVLLNSSILRVETDKISDSRFTMRAVRDYQPATVAALSHFGSLAPAGGMIFLMNSSHQDIAWMDSPEKCILFRDTMLLAPLIRKATTDKNYRFDVEDVLMVREYIHRHPDQKELIKQLLNEGRISCGSSYNQPYEGMYGDESLAREFYLGSRWMKEEFDYVPDTYWNVDVPGRTLQMPQLLKKSGTVALVTSRMDKGMYRWIAPDGSEVITYSPGHYSDAFTPLHREFSEAARYIAANSSDWQNYFSDTARSPVMPILSDWDMSPANDYSRMIRQWESIAASVDTGGNRTDLSLPAFRIVTAPEFFSAWKNASGEMKELRGERPDVWLYIHGPSHEQALTASREGDILLPMAEKFATANALAEGSFRNYPSEELEKAWEAKIYPDHGWGGKNGDITDNTFLRKFEYARSAAKTILNRELHDLASKINTRPEMGIPVIVFNSTNWTRSDLAGFKINFDPGKARNITLSEADGTVVPVQLSGSTRFADGTLQSASVYFIANEVPSVGYKTFYFHSEANEKPETKDPGDPQFENQYYKATFGNGGLLSLYDKELDKEILGSSVFKGGEVFTLRSIGNGAGEFADIQQPDTSGFDKTGNYRTGWKVVDSGLIYTAFRIRCPIRYATIEETIRFYQSMKKIDFEINILNWEGVLYREFRMALPLNLEDGEVTYEVPYGKVTVGKDEISGAAGERYRTDCKTIHPREIENWIGADGKDFGAMLSSSVAVADWIDPIRRSGQLIILQPILLASRKSCHPEGNDYLQTGDHHYIFSLTTHQPGWKQGYRFGRQANEALQVVTDPRRNDHAALPEEMSFFSIDSKNIIVTAIKKAEDDNGVIIRFFDMEGIDSEPDIKFFKPLNESQRTSLTEYPQESLKVVQNSVKVKTDPYSIETIRVR